MFVCLLSWISGSWYSPW